MFLSQVIDTARALGDAFKWTRELADAEEALYEMTCLESHG
jgi:hypothetical protein